MPTSIAATKRVICGSPRKSPANAGPGQRLASPQPIPNKAAPISRRASGLGFVGTSNRGARQVWPFGT